MPSVKDKKSKVCIESNDQTVRTTLAPLTMNEHDKAYSRTLRRDVEIGVGMHGTDPQGKFGGLVPSNPFASQKQMAYMNANPDVLGQKGLSEWNRASKGMKLPVRAKKK